MTKEETQKILKLISGTWNNFDPTGDTLDAWSIVFAEEEAPDITRSALHLCRNHTAGFAPTPAEIIRKARKLRFPLLAFTPEEHKKKRTLLWTSEVAEDGRLGRPYTPYVSEATMLKDVPFIEKEILKKLQSRIDHLSSIPAQGCFLELKQLDEKYSRMSARSERIVNEAMTGELFFEEIEETGVHGKIQSDRESKQAKSLPSTRKRIRSNSDRTA